MKVALIVLALIGAVLVGFVYTRDPATGYGLPPCSFKVMTGYHCPGCGGTRSAHALLHGRIEEAVYYNPLFIGGLAMGALAIGWWWLRRELGFKGLRMSTRQGVTLAAAIITAILGFGVIRNLSWYPWLKPPALVNPADKKSQ